MTLHGNQAIIVAYVAAAAVTCAATPIARRISVRTGALDVPNERKVHSVALPTSGGLAIIPGVCMRQTGASTGVKQDLL